MEIGKKFLILLSIVTAIAGLAMDDQHIVPPSANNIPFENNIRLVFMGRTGAGKSTLINAFYNYTKRIKWNDSPKHFPIPTEFQSCNITEYQGRNTENHSRGQLGAVTQEPSEYISRGENFVVSLIDCPGTADTRGIEQDITNTAAVADFMKKVGDFNAICIVLPVTINRDTAETKYFIEQIKSIIPTRAYDRIFICVSYTTANNENIKSFVQSIGLPVENILYFDNYAISKDGHGADLTVDLNGVDEQVDDPFGTPNASSISVDQQKKMATARKIKESWLHSNQEFNKLLRKAKSLGRFTSADMGRISELKNLTTEKILQAYKKIESIEQCEAALQTAQGQLRIALEDYNLALQSKNSADIEYQKAKLDKQSADALALYETYEIRVEDDTKKHNTICRNCEVVCHAECGLDDKGEHYTDHLSGCAVISNGNCTVCPGKCPHHYHKHAYKTWKTVTKTREMPHVRALLSDAVTNYNTWQQATSMRSQELASKQQDKDDKNNILTLLSDRLNCLRVEKDALQNQIVGLYVELGQVSMSSINFHIGEYYDICIRKETDSTKRAKLNRDRQFYTEQVELYKQRMARDNS